ncbi:hypothetical protein C3747_280g2 [Trypanosoma cruzi]|uniref:Tyr recombinase domain-containing protein n=1 Tax=Trypanosoma cruzi TaxID=5693 RepID=A0A2V2VGL5_TRYCR|nr:hypothetical protein C3747_280g2 [Trypanosoma cruzi]
MTPSTAAEWSPIVSAQRSRHAGRATPRRGPPPLMKLGGRTDWKERVVLRLAWITASCWSEIAALTLKNFTLEADGTLTLYRSVASKTAKADPHCAPRFVRIRGQDALDTIKLCRTPQENEKLTNLATAKVERALVHWNATAHSTKRVRRGTLPKSWKRTI